MPDDDKIDKVIAEQQRRERDAAVERARDGEGGFDAVVDAIIVDDDGVPDRFLTYETGAAWIGSTEDRAGDN